MSKNKPAALRSNSNPVTKPASERIQSGVDRKLNPSPSDQRFKASAMRAAELNKAK